MAEQETEEQEPSIEEILTSIRQIISDDEDEGADEASAADVDLSAEGNDEEGRESDVDLSADEDDGEGRETDVDLSAAEEASEEAIELTDIVDEPEPEPASEPDVDADDDEPEEEVKVEMQDIVEDNAPPQDDDLESILTSGAENAALDGFSQIVRKTAVEHGGITLEEIVRTELNPLLREWLDKNLPSIIDRLVQEELERVAKRAMEE